MHARRLMISGAAAAVMALAASAAAAGEFEYKTIPGVSPEPIKEGAGLKSKEDLEAFLDGVMTAHLRAQHIAGATVSVVKDGKLFFAKGYGYADVEKKIPVDPATTLFRPGSISKTFTWTALMQLVEQGKVKLDADVNTYLTQFKLPDTYPGKPITIKNLLTHTEGLEDGGLGYLIVKDPARMESPVDALAKHIPARVREPASGDFTNGDMASYSNWGTSLAGLIVANVSGMPFDDYVEKNILAPLGMTHSSPRQPLPPALAKDMSIGYRYEAAQFKPQTFEYVNLAPAGMMSATATDMAKFMIAHLQKGEYEGKRILKEETATLMHARALSPNPYINGACLGFYENHINGRRLIVHGGDTGWFHSEMNLLPEENVGIFVSVNTAPTLLFSTRIDLLKAFMDRYYPAKLPEVKPPEDFKQRVAKYAGSYRIIRHSYTTLEKAASIANAMTVAPTDHNTLVIGFGPFVGQWVEVKPDVFRKVDQDDMLAFSEGPDGRAATLLDPLSLPNHMAYRLSGYETPQTFALIVGFGVRCFIVAVVSALRHWKSDREAPARARLARRAAGALGAVHLLFLLSLGVVTAVASKNPLGGIPKPIYVSLVFPLLAVPVTLAVLYFAGVAWKEKFWTRYGRVQYTLIALGSLAFLWLLNYANLVGYKFG
jgi:CubicO group peptidase (beta-lactamase class C family)